MPKRTDIQSILVIGAGPIVIGQACEFDYSGTQAIKALKEEGYRIVLVNSNPATIMTDPDLADATYVEPITPEIVAKIIAKERPDAVLPTMGGQTALNTALALFNDGTLEKYGVEMIGADAEAIDKAEDRIKFRDAMDKIGLESARSGIAHTLDEAFAVLERTGLPSIIRPSFTMGGTGGGIAYNREEFEHIVRGGLIASPTTEVLIEESLLGWKEFEMEVVRDRKDNCIIICSIENVDPMGVHTGDSITVAPALTLTDKEYQIMRNASIAVLREIGVETGGSNVQFAVNPKDGRLIVIEMNPRVSRSSALASKATGFPIAKVAAKLAVGYTLDEIMNDITGVTPASFEPTIDYVVTKIPRFAFEKFKGAEATLSTAMKSVGEVMAIGRTIHESLQKALRGLETGLSGFNFVDRLKGATHDQLRSELAKRTPDRLLNAAQAIREGLPLAEINRVAGYDMWFLERIAEIVAAEVDVCTNGLPRDAEALRKLKAMGFSDKRLAYLALQSANLHPGTRRATARGSGLIHDAVKAMTGGVTEAEVRALRHKLGVRPVFKTIDTCAAEFAAKTPYLYSTYEAPTFGEPECEANPSDRKKVVILGGGPNRIGQGIEFDYCCCHACFALEEAGYETIMINCNPETVSTDYDTSDRLYFEPLTAEDVLEILHVEMSKGELVGVIVQFGGQTPLKLAQALSDAGIPILGTSPDAIDLAEDRERFAALVNKLGLKQPENGIARSREEAVAVAARIGYPVLTRPSYVLGGRAMEIVDDQAQLENYIETAVQVSGDSPVLIDRYLRDAIEVDVDALCDGTDVVVAGVLQHIEEAGVHSGDSACSIPPYSLSADIVAEIERQTEALARALEVRGLMNIQFAVKGDEVYLIEVNPRASRTVPFVAKAVGSPIAKIAARVMAGEKLADLPKINRDIAHVAVKEAVFPFARFPGTDPVLSPEMKSTGEVMGIDSNFNLAFAKAQLGAGDRLPTEGRVFVSVKDSDKPRIIGAVKQLTDWGWKVIATGGTADYLIEQGIEVERVNKVAEGRPHIVDRIKDGDVQLIFNTTEGWQSLQDSQSIRASALAADIAYYTTAAASDASTQAIGALRSHSLEVKPLQDYY
ncbi:MAG: carbamoyl-phosphate synthase large subunit [Sphingopyxis sp.]|jgi:carbamoyl-phosphate synthase large subunit|uniref:carbamoyl-phosphate synthase large subunit n=2 Tax=Sphingopyxis TaxID=165697 RepID=UPI00073061AE|nr:MULTISPECIES: carbamoyl-phosphate synthase large subunit [unclassified Sphingopyxis]KTE01787.1 carbamoyl phosphate synthase large subunit [Sphingopyxis sp. H012]KTE11797.1 carbamoyl phosphate synthase large subunit [Sphingopyxis sp. H053]KTE16298.1 carbamoyl phosphate synthase large subunit [Sphingopyxis sp. H093]KTE29536.1 carbamoyl phosphate synthase large subunit [Sphingopyxis sp. H080]KTE34376.1 carbamoyl phosphate synthase large subunit [Sphingopyxis sp. H038]